MISGLKCIAVVYIFIKFFNFSKPLRLLGNSTLNAVNCNSVLVSHVLVLFVCVCVFCDSFLCYFCLVLFLIT